METIKQRASAGAGASRLTLLGGEAFQGVLIERLLNGFLIRGEDCCL